MNNDHIVKQSLKGEIENFLNKGVEECDDECELTRVWADDMLGKGSATLARVQAS